MQYPTIARIAKDYLAIQGSAVPISAASEAELVVPRAHSPIILE